ncbi:MAG: hypothetical protein WA918_02570 [Erythrobacter sp.]
MNGASLGRGEVPMLQFPIAVTALGALALVTTAVSAQVYENQRVVEDPQQFDPARSAQDGDIVVTAPRTEKERRKELREMVKTIIRKPRRGRPIETFYDPPCTEVLGLPEKFATAIEAGIGRNVQELGIDSDLAKAPCVPNVIVVFVSPEAGPADAWFDRGSGYLAHLQPYERARVLNEKGPVRAWSHSVMRSANGPRLPDADGMEAAGGSQIFNPVFSPGRLRSAISMELARSAIFIEVTSAAGKSIDQLSDYITMRAFANLDGIDPGEMLAAPTILTLFADQDPPAQLTEFDRAFLTELYSMPLDEFEHRQYSLIASQVAEAERETASVPRRE